VLTIRAWVDAHGEASDGGKNCSEAFLFLELDHLRMEKPRPRSTGLFRFQGGAEQPGTSADCDNGRVLGCRAGFNP
jgi:hypothetical protein